MKITSEGPAYRDWSGLLWPAATNSLSETPCDVMYPEQYMSFGVGTLPTSRLAERAPAGVGVAVGCGCCDAPSLGKRIPVNASNNRPVFRMLPPMSLGRDAEHPGWNISPLFPQLQLNSYLLRRYA